MKTLHLLSVAAVLLAGACATVPKEPPPRPFAGTRWELLLELPAAGERPWLRFGDGRIEGYGGCNRIEGRYVQDAVGAHAIGIGRIERGRHACDRSAQSAEDRWLDVLHSASSWSITGDVMTMSGSEGTLRFRASGGERK